MNVANNYFILTSATTPGIIQIATGRTYLESVTINTGSACTVGLYDSTSAIITNGASGTVTGVGIKVYNSTSTGYFPQNITFANGLRLNLEKHAGHVVIAYRQ